MTDSSPTVDWPVHLPVLSHIVAAQGWLSYVMGAILYLFLGARKAYGPEDAAALARGLLPTFCKALSQSKGESTSVLRNLYGPLSTLSGVPLRPVDLLPIIVANRRGIRHRQLDELLARHLSECGDAAIAEMAEAAVRRKESSRALKHFLIGHAHCIPGLEQALYALQDHSNPKVAELVTAILSGLLARV